MAGYVTEKLYAYYWITGLMNQLIDIQMSV